MFEDKVNYIVENAVRLHGIFYNQNLRKDPGFYFSRRAIEKKTLFDKAESIYAMLPAWGMLRSGNRGPKMKSFEVFFNSIQNSSESLSLLEKFTILDFNDSIENTLRKLFTSIDVMETSCALVGNSKVLARLVPDIVGPIDGLKTLKFLRKGIPKTKDEQANLFINIIKCFFYKVAKSEVIRTKFCEWKANDQFIWDTSLPKTIDNLVLATVL